MIEKAKKKFKSIANIPLMGRDTLDPAGSAAVLKSLNLERRDRIFRINHRPKSQHEASETSCNFWIIYAKNTIKIF